VALDPIVSLSVALAEAPGTCAFFLGSGVSRDAGVPTVGEIMRAGLRSLYQLETGEVEDGDEAFEAWLRDTEVQVSPRLPTLLAALLAHRALPGLQPRNHPRLGPTGP
jgi:hypothetical protein